MNSDILSVLKNYGFDESDVTDVRELPSGINRVYSVTVNDKKYVLKQYIKTKSPELDQIHAKLVDLMQSGFPIPPIVANKQGEFLTKLQDRNFDLSEFITHIDLSDQVHITDSDLRLVAETFADVQKQLNTPELKQILKPINFEKKVDDTLEAIKVFKATFPEIRNKAGGADQAKLDILLELVQETDAYRSKGKAEFTGFLDQEFVPTQGDFSMVNVLITDDRKVYVIDWDGLSLRPLIWDLQAAISLFSLRETGNAYIMEPDYHKAEIFLRSYLAKAQISKEQLLLLPEVVKYNFAIYWLSYTLPAVNEYDFRLLFLIPDVVEKGIYWVDNFDEYTDFINKIAYDYH